MRSSRNLNRTGQRLWEVSPQTTQIVQLACLGAEAEEDWKERKQPMREAAQAHLPCAARVNCAFRSLKQGAYSESVDFLYGTDWVVGNPAISGAGRPQVVV